MMLPLGTKKYELISVTMQVNQFPITMEVDTGATLFVISEATYCCTWGDNLPPLTKTKARQRTYAGEEIPVKGGTRYQSQPQKQFSNIVTEGRGPSCFGRNWLEAIQIDW